VRRLGISRLERRAREGESPVHDSGEQDQTAGTECFLRVGLFGSTAKMGGEFHLKLNTGERPIANKYREGKMKRTLKRELNST
jgi:hypothetical protein